MTKQDFVRELDSEDPTYKKFSKTFDTQEDDSEGLDKQRMEVDELAV